MSVRIEGKYYESAPVSLKVKVPDGKGSDKKETSKP